MRLGNRTHRATAPRTVTAGIPVAVAGSIALVLSGTPAFADARVAEDRALRVVPSGGDLRSASALPRTAPAPKPLVAAAAPKTAATAPAAYTVQRGDTVSAIASRFGLRTADVLALNGLTWKSIIYPGQVLKLSGGASAAAPAPAAPAQSPSATYTVVRGDTVSAIAKRHGVSTQAVLTANGLSWSSVIHPGQKLVIPGKAAASTPAAPVAAAPAPAPKPAPTGAYTVVRGDTISAIAKRHGVTIQAVLTANKLGWSSIIYPGQKLAIPGKAAASAPAAPAPAPVPAPAPSGSYVVKAGDTVSAIASRHGVTVNAVLSANGLGMSSIIYPGQKLTIPGGAAGAAAPAPASVPGLDAEQVDNARLIIQIGRQLGVPDRGIAIALGTAMQESWLRNLDWGDRDSLGLFQQRPSTGWGTAAEVRDRARSIKVFYGGPSDPNGSRTRGLLDIRGWQSMSFAQAAQAVQISAYPDRYARWEKPAYAWLAALG